MKWKGIVFDFDYTLGDSTKGIVASINYAMKKLGHQKYPEEAIRKTVGLSLFDTYRQLTEDENPENAGIFASCFRDKADEVMASHTQLYPGVLEGLREWKKAGMKLGIVTTKYHYRIDQILKLCHGEGIFDRIVGGEDVEREKPDPEGLLFCIDAWGMKKEEVLYVGDSLVDAKTAKNAGVPFCAVTTGTTDEEAFRPFPHVGIYESVNHLIHMEHLI
ncbi:MAG TPA: HAD-IA family hydrolase [Candidatus Pelethocola excrementipullorum]|nr:HAD-IA family hydrolase [Candidatus Pelethocola excrementipullorum]